jgi:glyoxylase-like metal-dependent hydrolase (beta-lactamase superfamily II)
MRITSSLYLVGGTPEGLTDGNDCHVYLIKGQSGIFLIDAGNGYDTEGLLHNIEMEGFNPKDISHILITHHHTDHARGARALKERIGCEVWISSNTGKHLLEKGTDEELGIIYAKAHGMYDQNYVYQHCPVAHGIEDGEEFDIAGVRIKAINVIGHSHDSMCFVMRLDGRTCLFNGDTFSYGGVLGLLNYPMSSLEWYHQGLPKLKGLGVDGLYPGHGIICIRNGQNVLDAALNQLHNIFVPQSVGQAIIYHV